MAVRTHWIKTCWFKEVLTAQFWLLTISMCYLKMFTYHLQSHLFAIFWKYCIFLLFHHSCTGDWRNTGTAKNDNRSPPTGSHDKWSQVFKYFSCNISNMFNFLSCGLLLQSLRQVLATLWLCSWLAKPWDSIGRVLSSVTFVICDGPVWDRPMVTI